MRVRVQLQQAVMAAGVLVCTGAAALAQNTQAPAPAPVQAPVDACAAFKWPIGGAKSALSGDVAKVASGAKAGADFELALAPNDQVAFPVKPQRSPKKAGTFGGFVTADAPKGKLLQVTASDYAWIDVVQDGKLVRTKGFSTQAGCENVRKSVRFVVRAAQPVTVQISGADRQTIRVDIRDAD